MAVQLQQEDFRRIVALIQALPNFQLARDRRRFVGAAL